jgi:hypothetical protein
MIKDNPDVKGCYVAYVNGPVDIVAERIFLVWSGLKWFYPLSDQVYRDHVYQCIGPLPVLPLE